MNEVEIFKQDQLIPLKENENGEVIIDGRELHEFLKVQQDFSHWIKNQLELTDSIEGKTHSLLKTSANNGGGTKIDYILTLDIAKEICMIAGVAPRTNEETKKLSKKARRYFIQIEKAWNSPEMVMKRALEIANKRVKTLKIENQQQKQTIKEQKPKVIFADAVSTSHTSILVGELAKLIKQNGIDIGQGRLFQWLRDNGYLIKRKGTDYNMPTQKSMDLEIIEIKERTVTDPGNGSTRITKTPKVTGKGQQYFINKFLKEN
ncbi:phage antirepressor KilAC domain-containing protein [Clostridium botulinum]|uniref:phage antirepressor KilAC domain-containing protein n=1 Tax=Clostridium botulinum TaxID=1491 RepID=UPI001967DE8E|nr:phage antirepressor KilAC domain-containing protein [Clostridium botulinum]MBN1058507.1 oxidoreductase [Clostridium botulinum]